MWIAGALSFANAERSRDYRPPSREAAMVTKANGDDGTATAEQILLGGVIAEATADAMAKGMSLDDVFETLSACLGVAAEGLSAQSADAVLASSAMLASHGLALNGAIPLGSRLRMVSLHWVST